MAPAGVPHNPMKWCRSKNKGLFSGVKNPLSAGTKSRDGRAIPPQLVC